MILDSSSSSFVSRVVGTAAVPSSFFNKKRMAEAFAPRIAERFSFLGCASPSSSPLWVVVGLGQLLGDSFQNVNR